MGQWLAKLGQKGRLPVLPHRAFWNAWKASTINNRDESSNRQMDVEHGRGGIVSGVVEEAACQECLTEIQGWDHRQHPRSCFIEAALISSDRAANACPMMNEASDSSDGARLDVGQRHLQINTLLHPPSTNSSLTPFVQIFLKTRSTLLISASSS
jgi:hypothetical protein